MEGEINLTLKSSFLVDASIFNTNSLKKAIQDNIDFNRICIIKKQTLMDKNLNCNEWYSISINNSYPSTLIYLIDEEIIFQKENENNDNNKNEIKHKYDLMMNPMIFILLKYDNYEFDIRDLNKSSFEFPVIEVTIKRLLDSIPQKNIKFSLQQSEYHLKNLPLAKKIFIKRITYQSENFSTRITNMKNDKFKSADKLLVYKLSPLCEIKTHKMILDERVLEEKNRKAFIKFFSLNEVFYIENLPVYYDSLNLLDDFERFMIPFALRELDLFKGIYANNHVFYKIEKIEYEEYDKLNEFLKDEKLYKIYSSLDRKPFINAFYIDKETEVEFITERGKPTMTNLDLFLRLPKFYLHFVQSLINRVVEIKSEISYERSELFNSLNGKSESDAIVKYFSSFNFDAYKYCKNYEENKIIGVSEKFNLIMRFKQTFDKSLKNQTEDIYKLDFFNKLFFEITNIIENNFSISLSTKDNDNNPFLLSITGPHNLGVTDILRKVCDFKGFYFIKKDLGKYDSINQVLNYFKKIEFMQIYCHKIFFIKNMNKIFKLMDKDNNFKIKSEFNDIFGYQRINNFDRNCFIFHFEKNSEIKSEFKDLFSYNITYNLSDSDSREFFLKKAFNNYFYNYFTFKNMKIGSRINKRLKKCFLFGIFQLFDKKLPRINKIEKKSIVIKNERKLDREFDFDKAKERESLEILKLNEIKISFLNKEIEFLLNFYYQIFLKTDFKELARLTIGFDLKEFKNLTKDIFDNFYVEFLSDNKNKISFNSNADIKNENLYFEFEVNDYFKQKISRFKKIRMKIEKTISAIPEVKWSDVGGLENAKEDIYDTIQLPLKFPKLFNNDLKRRSGLLLYGPPGSGKTLLAKAIANECSMNFISIKGPELLNMYVGESEKNIREVFERGRANKPCVLFFDEIDAMAPARTKNSDQGNVMDRIVAQFMTEMDGILKGNALIIIASTNRPDLVDPSLLRPGRFDKMIYVGFPRSKEEKKKILIAQTKKFKLEKDVDFEELVNTCPLDYSGADIYAVSSQAFTFALKEFLYEENIKDKEKELIEKTKENYLTLDDVSKKEKALFCVKKSHFVQAIQKISPSISRDELQKYEELKKKFS